jgi:UDP-glucose 4-epimerase
MAKVLVTGGLGYIGSHAVVDLLDAGHTPIIIDNLSNSDIGVLDRLNKLKSTNLDFYQVEMCHVSELELIFQSHPDLSGVIHFAAWLQVPESVAEPSKYYYNNIVSTINLIDTCVEFNVKNIVFSSSCTVYGQPDTIPVNEKEPIKRAESPYGNTKIICEQMLEDAVNAYGLNVMCLRYFNPIGAHESAEIGEVQHGVPHHLVPFITETAVGKRDKLKVFGGDYDTHDGTCIRDYIHVSDISRAHVLALDIMSNEESLPFDAINLGSGEGQTVLEMIQAFERVTQLKVPYEIAERRAGDVEKVYADISKAKKVLNWTPENSLDKMLESAWNWQQNLKSTI